MWNKTYDVNVTGTHILTWSFAPLLLKSDDPRLMFIASGTSSLAGSENPDFPVNNQPSKGWPKTLNNFHLPAYRSSKTAMNMMMRYLKSGQYKRTELTHYQGMVSTSWSGWCQSMGHQPWIPSNWSRCWS